MSVTYTYGVLYRKLIQFIPIIMILRSDGVPQKEKWFKIQSSLYE